MKTIDDFEVIFDIKELHGLTRYALTSGILSLEGFADDYDIIADNCGTIKLGDGKVQVFSIWRIFTVAMSEITNIVNIRTEDGHMLYVVVDVLDDKTVVHQVFEDENDLILVFDPQSLSFKFVPVE
ncbi:hypothetical protein H7Y40_01260 [Pedobacter sp.]|nr:hypothetical protein [Candidatus Saccharibacteria bacterium]